MPLLDRDARGVFIIAPTPFSGTGRLDLEGTDQLVDWYLSREVDGLTILGQMGEATKLTLAESQAFARRVLNRVDGRVPVIVGASSPGYATTVELARDVMAAGAAGVMVAAPSTVKGDEAARRFFGDLAELLGPDTPWVLQDFPLSGTPPLTPALIRRIADECGNCVMLKHEDWPGLEKITALRRYEAEGAQRLSILVGNGGAFLPLELGRGADGAMTGYCFPEMLVAVCRLHAAGRVSEAWDIFDRHLPLLRYEQQPGIGLAARKHVLHRRGALRDPALRAPAPTLTAEAIAEIDLLLARLQAMGG